MLTSCLWLSLSVLGPADAPPPVQRPESMVPAPPPTAADAPAPAEVTPPGPAPAPAPTEETQPAPAPEEPTPAPPPEAAVPAAEVTAPVLAGLEAPVEQPDPRAAVDARVQRAAPKYRSRRTGFLAGAGAALAASMGMFIGVIVSVDDLENACENQQTYADIDECDQVLRRVTGLEMGATVTGFASMALSGVGGSYWGKADAAEDWLSRTRPRTAKAPLIAGGVMVGVGGIATIGSSIGLFSTCLNDSPACNTSTVKITLATFATGVIVTSVGAALLGYGVGYRGATAKWTRRAGQFSLAPTRSGLSLGYRARF